MRLLTTMRQKLLIAALLAIWCTVPLFAILFVFFFSNYALQNSYILLVAAIIWSVASLALFVVLLANNNQQLPDRKQHLHGLLGLIFTLMLGLPAIACSVAPLLGSQLDYMQSMSTKGTTIDLSQLAENSNSNRSAQKPILYIVGIDVSTSFIDGSEDAQVKDVIETLTVILRDFPSIVQGDDSMIVFLFAGNSLELMSITGQQRIIDLQNDLPGRITEALNEKSPRKLDRSQSDLLAFMLARACPAINDSRASFHEAKVILFSDFIQSTRDEDWNDGRKLSRSEILQKIEGCLRPISHEFLPVTVTAFQFPPPEQANKADCPASCTAADAGPVNEQREVEEGAGEDTTEEEAEAGEEVEEPEKINEDSRPQSDFPVDRYMATNCPDQWFNVDLNDFLHKDTPEIRRLRLTALYRKIVLTERVYLKYVAFPDFRAIDSEIKLPNGEELDTLTYGLFRSSETTPNFRVRFFPGKPEDFVLAPEEGHEKSRAASEPEPLRLRLDNRLDSMQYGRCDLLIAIPQAGLLFKVPIVALPVLDSKASQILVAVIFVLHLFPLALAFVVFRDTCLQPRQEMAAVDTPPAAPKVLTE